MGVAASYRLKSGILSYPFSLTKSHIGVPKKVLQCRRRFHGFSSLMKFIVSQAVSSVSHGKPCTVLATVIKPRSCAVACVF